MTKQECRQIAMEIIKILKEEGYTIAKTSDILEETVNKEEFLKTFNNSDDDIKVSLSKEEIESLTADNIAERIQIEGSTIVKDTLERTDVIEGINRHELLKKIYHVKKNYRIENSDNVDEFTMQQSQLAFTLGVFFYNEHVPAITNVLSKKYTDYQDFNRIYAGISTILNEITILYNVDRKKLYNDYILIDILFDLMMSTTKYVSEIIPVVMENIETWKNNMILGVDLTIYKKESMTSDEFRFTMYRLFLKLVYDKEFIYPEFFKNKIENITF